MKSFALALVCAGAIAARLLGAQTDPASDVNSLELQGRFKEAAASLDRTLKDSALPLTERERLEFERDRLERIPAGLPLHC